MDDAVRTLIQAVHNSGRRCVLAVTGGGASAVAMLFNVPGASRSILEVIVPYHERSLAEWLGHAPEQFCSVETARRMAGRAWERAGWLAPGEAVVGLGCTASLATDRPKRGDHRFHIAAHSDAGTRSWSLILTKGARDREGEEAVLDAVLLNGLAETVGLQERVGVPLLPGETIEDQSIPSADILSALLSGEIDCLCATVSGCLTTGVERPAALVPGSFNPAHTAHRELAQVGRARCGGSVAFEMSVTNVDKAALSVPEIRRRLAQFAGHAPVWLTRAPTFVEKARLFPNVVFLVGADTAARIVMPRYYDNSEVNRDRALEEVRRLGCRFLVAGRCDAGGRFLTIDDLEIPSSCRDLFTGLSAAEFQIDLSSTQLRGSASGKAETHETS